MIEGFLASVVFQMLSRHSMSLCPRWRQPWTLRNCVSSRICELSYLLNRHGPASTKWWRDISRFRSASWRLRSWTPSINHPRSADSILCWPIHKTFQVSCATSRRIFYYLTRLWSIWTASCKITLQWRKPLVQMQKYFMTSSLKYHSLSFCKRRNGTLVVLEPCCSFYFVSLLAWYWY